MVLGQVVAASNGGGVLGGFVSGGLTLVLLLLGLVGLWKTLEKGGESGAWALLLLTGCLAPVALVPMARLAGRPAWWVLLLYVPIVNIVVLAVLSIDLAKSFGKGAGYGVGLWLLGWIFYPMLGFGSATYAGPAVPARA